STIRTRTTARDRSRTKPFSDNFNQGLRGIQMNRRISTFLSATLAAACVICICMQQPGAATAQATTASAAAAANYQNVRVTQDHNPLPKATVASAIDPSSGNWVVMNVRGDRVQFHVSTDNGRTWTDDLLNKGKGVLTVPYRDQGFPGVSFDNSGNSYMSTLN